MDRGAAILGLCQGILRSIGKAAAFSYFVIPAKAGIHLLPWKFSQRVMNSRLRGNDEVVVTGQRLAFSVEAILAFVEADACSPPLVRV